ncbi:aspartate--tRNA ligase [archaeon]|nr:aspartate--tRNA ligase [archaeon]|tara:strand:+ start:998 stop:2764 length:1767 start_codon:yes stop_codon:yes gene_type:complete
MLRTHNCGELRGKDARKHSTLAGWVQTRRDHGGVIFIDLRDRWGLTQIVFDPSHNKKTHKQAENLRREDVITATGSIKERKSGMKNKNLPTGEIEVFIDELNIINKAETPPIEVDDRKEASEEIRLKYRYLDLRRPSMQKKLILRHKVVTALREFLNGEDFLEIETPMLIKHTPEGARDFVVPSRLHPGTFYSLPQSPQLYKQILMIAGFDRYYQVARALRDEDLRVDRQPEHTQLDLEMSFAEEEDVLQIAEKMVAHVFKKVMKKELKLPFARIKYNDSMAKYGNDKPDLRFGLELEDVTEIAKKSNFEVFHKVIKKNGIVKCINAKNCGSFSRKKLDKYIAFAQEHGASGLMWMRMTDDGLESSVTKFFPPSVQKDLIKKMHAKTGDLLLLVADSFKTTNNVLSRIRVKLGKECELIDQNEFNFCFITDYPLFEWNEDEKKWDAMHHVFTMPKEEHIKYLDSEPGKVYGRLYDMVLNGIELFSGSVRTYKPDVQEKLMEIIGISKKQAEKKFGFLIEAYRYGAPIHAGFGLGIDRFVALLAGLNDIREVIAFPKTKSMEQPMDGCPSELDAHQLKELKLTIPKKNG